MTYNKTQLNPDTIFERHVFHRDQFAHYLRWSHVVKRLRIGMNILDFGCGTGNLCEVIYRNRYKAKYYLGVDVREKIIEQNKEKFKAVDWAKWLAQDLVKEQLLTDPFFTGSEKEPWDIICCFEVLEHVGKENAPRLLDNLKAHMSENTILLLSTPCFDPEVGPADNHIVDGIIGEFTYQELKDLLASKEFTIVNQWGTFASQKDYVPIMNEWQKKYYDSVKEYFDSNLLANVMAPLFPEHSRNVLWELKA